MALWKETLPYRSTVQQIFICCFCDILPAQAEFHSACYGRNALGLTKQWGIKNNISPVRYVHETSIGVSRNYRLLKNLFRNAGKMGEHDHTEMLRNYLCSAALCAEGWVQDGNILLALERDPQVCAIYSQMERELNDATMTIPEGPPRTAFFRYLNDLFNRIIELQNELEARDTFLRAYVEDFKTADGITIKGKVLYDEREWRSVKVINVETDRSHLPIYRKACEDMYLPSEYNLNFTTADLRFIVVDSDADNRLNESLISSCLAECFGLG